jgi:uncharacterized membrane protein HdeD (DUF308 family)
MLYDLSRHWWLLVLNGIAGVVFGAAAFFWPGMTFGALVLLFGAFAFVDGLVMLGFGLLAAGEAENWWTLLLTGVAGVVVGVLTFAKPAEMALALVYVIGIWAIMTGLLGVVAAISLRKIINDEWLLGLGGVLGIIFGIIVLMQPVAGALTVVYLCGFYATLFGITQIVLGIRLHGLVAAVERRVQHATSGSH